MTVPHDATASDVMVEVTAAVRPDQGVLDDIQLLLGYAAGIVFVLCAAKIIFVGARLAWDHRHGAGIESPPAAELVAANIGAILAGGAGLVLAGILLTTASGPVGDTAPQQGNLVEQIEQMPKPQSPQGDNSEENE